MNSRVRRDDFFIFGLFVSLSWHIFWFFLIVPVVKIPDVSSARSLSFFLGPILKDADLNVNAGLAPRKISNDSGRVSFSQQKYFDKSFQQIYKPRINLASGVRIDQPKLRVTERELATPISEPMTFGFSDVDRYVYNVDFSDIKKMVSREKLFAFMDFKVILNREGEVADIKKIHGCGDPLLDFYVMLKLKKAVFKILSEEGRSIEVHFNLK